MASKNQYELLNQAYTDYTNQLQKNKISAQNAIASSTEKAKSLLDTRLKSQGLNDSGMGLSQYTALANNMNSNIAQSNQAYNTELAEKGYAYQKELADYQDAYNSQIKNEAQNLFNMDASQIDNYLNALKGNNNVSEDTLNYLNAYSNAVKNQKSSEALDTAKQEISGLEDYSAIQKYLDSARQSGTLNDNQLSALESYADLLGYGWENTKNSYANELAEMMTQVTPASSDYGKLMDAYNHINGAKSSAELNQALKEYDINNLVNSIGSGKSSIDAYNGIVNMKTGDSLSSGDLQYLLNQNLIQKSGDKYTTTIMGKQYLFDKNGKLIGGGSDYASAKNADTEIGRIAVGGSLTPTQMNTLEKYEWEVIKPGEINYYVGDYIVTVNLGKEQVTGIQAKTSTEKKRGGTDGTSSDLTSLSKNRSNRLERVS